MIPSHDEVKAAAQRYAKDRLYKDLKIVLDTDTLLRERVLEMQAVIDDMNDIVVGERDLNEP